MSGHRIRAWIGGRVVCGAAIGLVFGVVFGAGCHSEPVPAAPTKETAVAAEESRPTVARIGSPKPTVMPEETPPLPQTPEVAPVPEAKQLPAVAEMREIFPHVRLDAALKRVEIDGIVPIDCHNPRSPVVYLEVAVCLRNTKEHEALVMTEALPSHVHAAILATGLEPGKPGSWKVENHKLVTLLPEGPALRVSVVTRDAAGNEKAQPIESWVVNAGTKQHMGEAGGKWLFSGSRIVPFEGKNYYDADGMGTLVGLTTFGGETVAWSSVYTPEATVEEPEWIADEAQVPAFGTAVVVRIEPAP